MKPRKKHRVHGTPHVDILVAFPALTSTACSGGGGGGGAGVAAGSTAANITGGVGGDAGFFGYSGTFSILAVSGGSPGNWDGFGSGGFIVNNNGSTSVGPGTNTAPPSGAVIQNMLPMNTWTNITLTYANNNVTNSFSTFINAISLTTSTIIAGPNPTFQAGPSCIIGSTFSGSIGQTLIYNRELKYTEIVDNFNATKSLYGY